MVSFVRFVIFFTQSWEIRHASITQFCEYESEEQDQPESHFPMLAISGTVVYF